MLRKVDVDSLMNQCRIELLGSSDALLKSMFFQVGTEFLNDTSMWTECISINAITTSNQYDLTPSEGQIIRLECVMQLDENGCPRFPVPGLMPDIPTFVASHAPSTNQSWVAFVVKNLDQPMLRDGLPLAPDWLLQRWFLAMKHGIIGEMANQKDKSWSDPKNALYHLSKFRKYIQDARVIQLKKNTNGATAWRFPQTFNGRSQQGGVPSFGGRERTF